MVVSIIQQGRSSGKGKGKFTGTTGGFSTRGAPGTIIGSLAVPHPKLIAQARSSSKKQTLPAARSKGQLSSIISSGRIQPGPVNTLFQRRKNPLDLFNKK